MRGATSLHGQADDPVFISIHAPLAGCDYRPIRRSITLTISIHAPLAGCDNAGLRDFFKLQNFNPRTPCGVRLRTVSFFISLIHFNPRTPCGVRPDFIILKRMCFYISIHAPLAGCDLPVFTIASARSKFQSTHPLRGATDTTFILSLQLKISIHAPLAGCDRDCPR